MEQGLKQQILAAKSAEVVNELLEKGKGYEFASRSTRNAWRNAAKRVNAWLKGEKYVAPAAVDAEEVSSAPKKKRGNKKKESAVVG